MTKAATQVLAGTILSYPALAQSPLPDPPNTLHDFRNLFLAGLVSITGQLLMKLGTKLINSLGKRHQRKRTQKKNPVVTSNEVENK